MNALVKASVGADGVGELRLNRPAKRNALSAEMLEEAIAAIAGFAERDIRVATFRAEGSVFCSGVDTTEGLNPVRKAASGTDLLDVLTRSPIFWVAVVEGPALGAGAAIPAVCPLSVAASNTWFSLPEINLGLYPAAVITYLEPRLGRQFCLEWGIQGQRIPAAEAQQRGLVSEVADPSDVEGLVSTVVSRLTSKPWATVSARETWQSVFAGAHFQARKAELNAAMRLPPEDGGSTT